MKLRVFYIIHSNYNYDTKKFKITRQQQDFPESATEETVSDELYAKYGKLGNYDGSGVLRPYMEIVSFTRINDEIPQRGSVDEWKATENSPFHTHPAIAESAVRITGVSQMSTPTTAVEVSGLITDSEADILSHASNNDGQYVTEEALALSLAERGYFENRGRWALAGGAFALAMTAAGRAALSEWRAAQPKPKKKRGPSPMFSAWMTYCELYSKVTLGHFAKEVWPYRSRYL